MGSSMVVGCPYDGGTVSTYVGGCRHEDGEACVVTTLIGDDLVATITSVDHIGSLEIVREHAAYFSTGAKADHAAYVDGMET